MDNSNRIYLSPPHLGRHEQKYVADAFASNWIAPIGPHVDAFQEEIARYVGTKGAVAVSSGTAAIHIALRLLDIEKDDLVCCSNLTFIASANPILYEKATPVFIDSERDSWNMSPLALRKALETTSKKNRIPKAVIVVNIYGQSAKIDQIQSLCDDYQVPIIEDAAESLGATYKNKKCGSFGKFGIFSFNGNKIITTSGGGMLVSDDLEKLEVATYLATQARDPGLHYQHSTVGYNYRMSNILAAIGRGQLEIIDERIEQRRRIFDRYKEGLSDIKAIQFMPELLGGRSTRWLTALTIDPELTHVTSVDVITALERENIEARPVWKPLHLQPLFKGYQCFTEKNGISFAKTLSERGVCLPSGTNLTESQQLQIIDILRACFGK